MHLTQPLQTRPDYGRSSEMKRISIQEMEERLAAKEEKAEEKDSKFEKGKPADPTKNMSPADKAKWLAEKEKNKDKFKKAKDEDEDESKDKDSKFEKGKPADPTKNMSPEDKAKWKAEKEKNKDKFKKADEPHRARFPEGKSVDVPEYLRDHGNPEAAEKWVAMNEEHGDKFKEASRRVRSSWKKASEPQAAKEAAVVPSGLYGYTKAVQKACEGATRKVNKVAAKLAKTAYQKDERVATFLGAHAKRSNSMAAKILVAAMKNIGPKIASEKEACGGDCQCQNQQGQQTEDSKSSWRGARQTESGMPFDNKMLLVESYGEGDQPVVAAEEPEAPTKQATDKEATEYGLYGYAHKTAKLGTESCHSLAHEVGKVAVDLHRRKADLHEQITGFFQNHGKTARCATSKYIFACYPDAAAKFASPNTVDDWLSWDKD